MRVLTVRQPWAWSILHGGKDVENRVRNVAGSYRGLVAIHAGLHPAPLRSLETFADMRVRNVLAGADDLRRTYAFGAILGVVNLIGVHESTGVGCGTGEGFGGEIPLCSEWADPWEHHLVLADPRPLYRPIPFRGALGLRTLPADVEAAVNADLARRSTEPKAIRR